LLLERGDHVSAVHQVWTPGSDISSSSCHTDSISLSAFGASLSRSYTFCPTKIHIEKTTSQFDSYWEGCKGASTTVGVAEGAFTRVPGGGNANLVYGIGEWAPNFSC
jgi:hypothetical protein